MATVRVRRGALTGVYVAGGASGFGTQMTFLALPWLVLETSGSATRTGLVFAVQVLPIALLGFIGGEVLQRLGAHRTMVTSDLVRGPLVALVPILHSLGALSLPLLLAIVAVHGVCGVPYFASQRVLATELVGADSRALTRVNSVLETVYNTASFAGPAVAGVLITAMGAAQVIWLDAATFLVSAALLAVFVPGTAGSAPSRKGPAGVWAGLRRLRADPFLRQSVISTVLYGFLLRVLAIALPLLAFERFSGNARVGGLLVAGSGAGALIGSFITYLVATRYRPRQLVSVSAVLLSLPLWVLVLPVPPVVLVAAAAVTSAAVPLSNAPYFGILAARVPAEFQPKVLQAVITMSNIAGPLGFLAAGTMTDAVGISATLTVVAALATLSTVNILAAMRHLSDSADDSKQPPLAAMA